jgi:hypothetical protein
MVPATASVCVCVCVCVWDVCVCVCVMYLASPSADVQAEECDALIKVPFHHLTAKRALASSTRQLKQKRSVSTKPG